MDNECQKLLLDLFEHEPLYLMFNYITV